MTDNPFTRDEPVRLAQSGDDGRVDVAIVALRHPQGFARKRPGRQPEVPVGRGRGGGRLAGAVPGLRPGHGEPA